MQYKQETIKRYLEKAKNAVSVARANIDNVHVHVSFGNRKIGKTLNYNLPAVSSCGGMCRKCGCLKYCYAIKDALRFPAVLKARAENFALLLSDSPRYWKEVAESINRHPSYGYIRFHVSGEIVNYDYFENMVKIARSFPARRFWTYTKQYEIVNAYCANNGGRSAIPSNLVIMFSNWDGYPMNNPYSFPTFTFVPDGKPLPQNVFVCGGNCDYCKQHNCGCVGGCSACVREH